MSVGGTWRRALCRCKHQSTVVYPYVMDEGNGENGEDQICPQTAHRRMIGAVVILFSRLII
jgi:hypothetical protein